MKELIGTYLVTRSETEMLKLRSKVPPSVLDVHESSMKPYMRPTIESTNKQKIKKEQGKNKSPIRSPRQRLCEEELEIFSQTDLKLQKILKPNYYHPQKYDDQMQTQWGEKKTYVQTSPHDDVIDFYGHKPRPPSGSSSSKKSRKQRINGPQTLEQFEEYLDKAKLANENNWVLGDECTAEENVPCKRKIFEDPSTDEKVHKTCKMQLSVKENEINKLKNLIEKLSRPYEAKMIRFEENQSKILKEEQKKAEQFCHQKQKKEDELAEMRVKYMRLLKGFEEYKRKHEESAEMENNIAEHQTEFEKMYKFKTVNVALSEEKYEMEDRIRKLQTKLDHYNNMKAENAKVRTELDAKTEEVNKLTLKLIRLEELKSKYYSLKSDNKKVWENCSDLKGKLEDKVNELENVNGKLNRLSLELKFLQRDRADVEQQNSELIRALQAKGIEIESLIKQRERSEEQLRNISNEISDIQKLKRHTENESLQQLLTENLSLKSTLERRNLEIENLSKECEKQRQNREKDVHEETELEQVVQRKKNEVDELNTRLQVFSKKYSALLRDKEEAVAKISALTDALHDKERDNESLTNQLERYKDLSRALTNVQQDKEKAENQISRVSKTLHYKEKELESVQNELARAEKNVSFLSKDIKDIQESKRQVADELQSLQTENISLKSDLSKATFEIEDLLNKDTNLQKYKLDAEHKTSTLMDTLKEKETKIETLKTQLSRAEKDISILSENIKDIRESKRQAADERLRGLQKENASLKADLSKASNEIEDFVIKDTSLQKYKTDAEHKISTLMNALQEKETEIEALNQHLARSEENVSILSKDIRNIQESKRQVADEKLQDLQTENASLKLTLAEANTEIDDLWNKCTKLQKYESETKHKIKTLLDAVEEKDTEIENLHKRLARSEKNVSILSKDIKDIQGSKHRAAAEKVQGLETENASLQLELAKATTEIDALRNKFTSWQEYKTDTEHTIKTLLNAEKEKEAKFEALNEQLARKNNELSKAVSNLQKDKENAEHQRNSFSKALDEKEKDIRLMRNEITRYKENISTLTKYVEEIQQTKNQAADENIKILQKKIDSSESDLRSVTSEMNELSRKYKQLQKDKESADHTINKFSKTVQERDKEIDSLVEEVAIANENGNKAEKIASAGIIQKLKEDNASLKSDLVQQKQETDKRVSDLTKEIQKLKKSKGTSSEEFNARKLYEENEFLKAQLDRTSKSYEQLRKDYNEVKREKDHALNRLSSVAGEKLRNNNPGIADLSDENRPINLGEKFSQLYDDQWTDAIEHLEEMGYSETNGIRCLLDILKAVFDECVKLSDNHFNQLKELTGTSHLPSDQLKKLKDLRKATAIHSVAKTKQLVNDYMSTAFSKEKAACQTYIDRSIELCWLMSVQDPPVVIDFIAIHGQAIDDKILRKFTKTGSKIDFLVWPVIRLHKNGPLLQKGVVQPI